MSFGAGSGLGGRELGPGFEAGAEFGGWDQGAKVRRAENGKLEGQRLWPGFGGRVRAQAFEVGVPVCRSGGLPEFSAGMAATGDRRRELLLLRQKNAPGGTNPSGVSLYDRESDAMPSPKRIYSRTQRMEWPRPRLAVLSMQELFSMRRLRACVLVVLDVSSAGSDEK